MVTKRYWYWKKKQNCSQGTVWDCADDNRWVINVWPPVHICYLKVVILSQVSAQKISVGLSVDNFWSLKILACGRLLAGGAVVYSSSCGLLKQWQHLWCHIYSVPPKRTPEPDSRRAAQASVTAVILSTKRCTNTGAESLHYVDILCRNAVNSSSCSPALSLSSSCSTVSSCNSANVSYK